MKFCLQPICWEHNALVVSKILFGAVKMLFWNAPMVNMICAWYLNIKHVNKISQYRVYVCIYTIYTYIYIYTWNTAFASLFWHYQHLTATTGPTSLIARWLFWAWALHACSPSTHAPARRFDLWIEFPHGFSSELVWLNMADIGHFINLNSHIGFCLSSYVVYVQYHTVK